MKAYFYKLLSLMFVAGIVCVAALAVWLVRHPYQPFSARPVAVWKPELQVAGGDAPAQTAAAYPETFVRPIFSPTRRPFQAAAAPPPQDEEQVQAEPEVPTAEPAAAPDSSQLQLKGIFIKADATTALVASAEKPEGDWIAVGGDVAGWKLMEIKADSVILMAAGQTVEIKQYVDKSQQGLGTEDPNQ